MVFVYDRDRDRSRQLGVHGRKGYVMDRRGPLKKRDRSRQLGLHSRNGYHMDRRDPLKKRFKRNCILDACANLPL